MWHGSKWICAVVVGVTAASATATAATPTLTVRTVDGQLFSLRAERGHWVVVNYWATWCEACREEMPMLSAFAAAHPSVRVVGLTYEDIASAALKKFVAD